MAYHRPVMLAETVSLLAIRAGGIYVDATFGGGGHTGSILSELGNGKLYAFDKDEDVLQNRSPDERLELIQSDFRFIEKELLARGVSGVDGILADLGISSHQVDAGNRGFSFRFDAPLDMRMDRRQSLSARDVLNGYSEEDLFRVFRRYGEVSHLGRLVRLILVARGAGKMETTGDLESVARECAPVQQVKKYLSQVFQSIRIEVNDELGALECLLVDGLSLLNPGGRFVILAYHSLEDRLVKQFFKYGNLEGEDRRDLFGKSLSPLKVVTRKVIKASEDEIEENPRARSARLRAAVKHD